MMSQKFEKQGCQWYEVKWIKFTIAEITDKGNQGLMYSLLFLLQVVFISSIKLILSIISLTKSFNQQSSIPANILYLNVLICCLCYLQMQYIGI